MTKRDYRDYLQDIINEYFGIDYQIVWKTAKKTLPKLQAKIAVILKMEIEQNT